MTIVNIRYIAKKILSSSGDTHLKTMDFGLWFLWVLSGQILLDWLPWVLVLLWLF